MTRALQKIKSNCDFQGVNDWISAKRSLLLLTHQRPDGDAIGSLIGLFYSLKEAGTKCTPFIEDRLPERYRDFVPNEAVLGGPLDLGNYDGLVCLDSANEKQLGIPNNLAFSDLDLACCNLDHHVDNSCYGEIFFVGSNYAATAELLTQFIKRSSLNISPRSATMFLIGIITDTGGFRFNNTTAATLNAAAWLMENHADYNDIMQKIYFEEPVEKLKLFGKLCESIRFAFNGRVAYFFLTPDLLSKYEVDEKDTEDLVDVARVIKGVQIVCRIQQVDEGIRFSIRSKNEVFPVNTLARQLGGGGHAMAAGAFVKDISLERGEEIFLNCAKEIFY